MVIADDDGPEPVKGGPELGGGQKRARLKAKARNAPGDAEPVTPSKTEESPSQRIPLMPRFKDEDPRGTPRGSSKWSQTAPARTLKQKRPLISVESDRRRNKKKSSPSWPLVSFQWGLEEYNSEDLRLEKVADGDFRVLGGGGDGVGCLREFSINSIRSAFVGVAPAFLPPPDSIRYTHKASSSVGRSARLDSFSVARDAPMATWF